MPERSSEKEEEVRRLRTLLDEMPQMVWANEDYGRRIYYNQQWLNFTGVAEIDGGFDRLSLVHPEDRAAAAEAWAEAQISGTYEHEYRLRHRSGEYRWIISRGCSSRDVEGRIRDWYGTSTDIHSRRLAHFTLQASEILNRTIIGASPDPTILLDLEGNVLFLNAAAANEVPKGLRSGMIGRNWFEAFPKAPPEARKALASARIGGKSTFALSHKYPGQPRNWWDVVVAPVFGEADEVTSILVVSRNITEAMETRVKLEELQSQLLSASRLKAMGTMAATLAHELNQPLAAASNFLTGARRIAKKLNSPDLTLLESGLEQATQQVQRAGEIIRKVRGMVGSRGPELEHASLTSIAKHAISAVNPAAYGVEWRCEIPPEADSVVVDVVQTEQVLVNLIRNACQAMVGSDVRKLLIRSALAKECVEVFVEDTGPGFASSISSLFEALEPSAGGSGMKLGLAISRTIVEHQGGKIHAENDPAGGARVCFTIPLATRGV